MQFGGICSFFDLCGKGTKQSVTDLSVTIGVQDPVVPRSNNPIHWINRYPIDTVVGLPTLIHWIVIHPVDYDVDSFEQLCQGSWERDKREGRQVEKNANTRLFSHSHFVLRCSARTYRSNSWKTLELNQHFFTWPALCEFTAMTKLA